MKHRKRLLFGLLAGAGLVGIASSQVSWAQRPGPFLYDSTLGIQSMLYQMSQRAQVAENEILRQRAELAELKKDAATRKDELAKLARRVRDLEINQNRKR